MNVADEMKSRKEAPKLTEIDLRLLAEIKSFIVSTNNVLMGIQVEGDNILRSASLMNKAHDLLKKIEGKK